MDRDSLEERKDEIEVDKGKVKIERKSNGEMQTWRDEANDKER